MKKAALVFLVLVLLFTGCGDEKNYTVKEVVANEETGRIEKRIFLNQSELDRIEKEVAEQGWTTTVLKGFEEEDFAGEGATSAYPPLEEDMFRETPIFAKCHLTKPEEVVQLDVWYEKGEEKRRVTYYATILTMQIDEVFYTDGEEKTGDEITVYFPNIFSGSQAYEKNRDGKGIRMELNAHIVRPEFGKSFYIFLAQDFHYYLSENEKKAIQSQTQLRLSGWETTIVETEKNQYEMNSLYTSLAEGAEEIPREERSQWPLDQRLKTGNFDQKLRELVEKYRG